MTDALAKVAYTVPEAAAAASVSVSTVHRAIHTTGVDTDGNPTFPPPLRAKKAGTGPKAGLRIEADELRRWVASFPDA